MKLSSSSSNKYKYKISQSNIDSISLPSIIDFFHLQENSHELSWIGIMVSLFLNRSILIMKCSYIYDGGLTRTKITITSFWEQA
jgi:hypothetical protein